MDMLVKEEKETLGPANHNLSQGAQAGLGTAGGSPSLLLCFCSRKGRKKEAKLSLFYPET